jgi:(R,R)-butanediol dehydrogenase/meso-butanediol dehydrogenase/diacetyl reductase
MIGLGVIYFLRRQGIENIVAVARSDQRRALAARMGAAHLVLRNDRLHEIVADTLGGPPDIVFDTAGAPGIVDQAIACVRPNGKVVVASLLMAPDPVCHGMAAFKEVLVQYSVAYDRFQFEQTARQICKDFATVGQLASSPVSLEEFPAQFEQARHRRDRCKVLVDPWAEAEG